MNELEKEILKLKITNTELNGELLTTQLSVLQAQHARLKQQLAELEKLEVETKTDSVTN